MYRVMTDYFLILPRMIHESRSDTAEMRQKVYELARVALRRRLHLANSAISDDLLRKGQSETRR
jgi:hypothetical protein